MPENAQQLICNATSDQAAIDEDILATLQDDLSAEMMPEVIIAFRTEVNQRIKGVAQALLDEDCSAASHHAHALKGTAATVGARALYNLALRIEQAGRNGDLMPMHAWIEQLRHQALLLVEELNRRYLGTGQPT